MATTCTNKEESRESRVVAKVADITTATEAEGAQTDTTRMAEGSTIVRETTPLRMRTVTRGRTEEAEAAVARIEAGRRVLATITIITIAKEQMRTRSRERCTSATLTSR
jgi:hypothetical protein